MKELKIRTGSRALVVVAHPDDETIWMGGTIRWFKDAQWTILSLCRLSDPDREPKFFRVCEKYGAKGIIKDLEDEGIMGIDESIPKIEKIITEAVGSEEFDFLFAHGANGEYGHERHIGTHLAVVKLLTAKQLRTRKALFFNYEKIEARDFSPLKVADGSDFIIRLSEEEFRNKKETMSLIYGFDPDGIDASYCTNPEAFKLLDTRQKA